MSRVTLEVHDPGGRVESTHHGAPRLADLNDKKIGIVTSSLWEADRVLGLLKELLIEQSPTATFVHWDDLPSVEELDKRLVSIDVLREKGCQAIIVGNGG